MQEQQESQIISQLQNNKLENFTLLYNQYFQKVYTFIFFKTLHKETAEDITSQTFLKAFLNVKKFNQKKGTFSTWIFTIAKHSVIDHYRSQKNTCNIEDCWDLPSTENLFINIANKAQLEKIKAQLNKLRPAQRDLIIMRIWQGMSYKEIAQITGKSQASLKMSFSRTIKTLRLELIFLILLFGEIIQSKQ